MLCWGRMCICSTAPGFLFDEALILQKTDTHISVAPGMRQLTNRTPVIELLDLGVTVAVTTDGSMLSSGFDMFCHAPCTDDFPQRNE